MVALGRVRWGGAAAALAVVLAVSVASCSDTRTEAEKLDFPESDPSTWPPSLYEGMSPEAKAESIAALGPNGECSPATLVIDYDAGLLSPEEFTAFAMYGMYRPPEEVPERYEVCPNEGAVAGLAMVSGLFIDDIDPEFRDELWLEVMGQPYWGDTDVTAPDEVDEPSDEDY